MAHDTRTRRTEVDPVDRPARAEPIAMLGRGRLVLIVATAVLAGLAYHRSTKQTAESVVSAELTMTQQIAFGQRAAPFFAAQHGGLLNDEALQNEVAQLGWRIVTQNRLESSGRDFRFFLLADKQNVAFYCLPGGTVLLTSAAYDRLETPGEKAAILAHALAHEMQGSFLESLRLYEAIPGVTTDTVLREIDPQNPATLDSQRVRRLIDTALQVQMNATQVELADRGMLHLLANAGFHPESMIRAWEKMLGGSAAFQQVSYITGDRDRIGHLRALISQAFPNGIPENLVR